MRADSINILDVSPHKNIAIREGMRAQFHVESSDCLDHVQFNLPNTTPTSTAFGTVTSEQGHGQRQIVFALKLLF